MAKDFVYKRILLKLSGEALAGEGGFGFDKDIIDRTVEEIEELIANGIEVCLVVGGGNMLRGAQNDHMDRSRADYIGMLATVMNSLMLQDAFESRGYKACVLSALPIEGVAPIFSKEAALCCMSEGCVVICAGGTGHPFFTTDGTAVLRALEVEADVLIKATKVDGVYDCDPRKNAKAIKFDTITYHETIEKNLGVMDLSAVAMCMENKLPLIVLNMNEHGAVYAACKGKPVGTTVTL
ncbi:MAG: UMP kinase [Eggerthellaceae bacterium]|nr:UMP kinase [Eggerthellaceae bacterium]